MKDMDTFSKSSTVVSSSPIEKLIAKYVLAHGLIGSGKLMKSLIHLITREVTDTATPLRQQQELLDGVYLDGGLIAGSYAFVRVNTGFHQMLWAVLKLEGDWTIIAAAMSTDGAIEFVHENHFKGEIEQEVVLNHHKVEFFTNLYLSDARTEIIHSYVLVNGIQLGYYKVR
jgi:hypothetical protein